MINNNDWIDRLRDKLDDYEAPPQSQGEDEELWGAIISSVRDQKNAGIRKEKKARIHPLWVLLPLTGAAACLILLWLLYRPHSPASAVFEEAPLAVSTAPALPENEPPYTVAAEDNKPMQKPVRLLLKQKSARSPKALYARAEPLAATVRPVIVEEKEVSAHIQSFANLLTLKKHTDLPKKTSARTITLLPRQKDPFASRLRASLISSGVSGSSGNIQGYGRRNSANLLSDSPARINEGFVGEYKNTVGKTAKDMISLFNQTHGTAIAVRRHPPLRVGVTVSYELLRGLSVETGLLYTREVADLREGSENYYYTTRYTDHMLGMPVALRLDFLKREPWSLHVVGSLMAEKSLSTTIQTDYHAGNDQVSSETAGKSFLKEPLRWSLRGAVGVQYALTKQLGIILEPGVTRHLTSLDRPYEELSPRTLVFDGVIGLSFDF